MTIRDTMRAVQALAKDPARSAVAWTEDEAEVLYLFATCEPPLAPAAEQHLMAQFVRLRDQAMLRAGIDAFGIGGAA